jgi:ribonuclease HII
MSFCETRIWDEGFRLICGVDEAGRGPLAGPVTAAAVILPTGTGRNGINDSKLLSARKRERLAEHIKSIALAWAVESVDHEIIDRINILQASLLAMRRAVSKLESRLDIVLVDGNKPIPNVDYEQKTMVKGDMRSLSIGAASIIAKVERDRLMAEYHDSYPQYNFRQNKGYPTREHRIAIHTYGPCEIHRKTFKLLPDGLIQGALSFER